MMSRFLRGNNGSDASSASSISSGIPSAAITAPSMASSDATTGSVPSVGVVTDRSFSSSNSSAGTVSASVQSRKRGKNMPEEMTKHMGVIDFSSAGQIVHKDKYRAISTPKRDEFQEANQELLRLQRENEMLRQATERNARDQEMISDQQTAIANLIEQISFLTSSQDVSMGGDSASHDAESSKAAAEWKSRFEQEKGAAELTIRGLMDMVEGLRRDIDTKQEAMDARLKDITEAYHSTKKKAEESEQRLLQERETAQKMQVDHSNQILELLRKMRAKDVVNQASPARMPGTIAQPVLVAQPDQASPITPSTTAVPLVPVIQAAVPVPAIQAAPIVQPVQVNTTDVVSIRIGQQVEAEDVTMQPTPVVPVVPVIATTPDVQPIPVVIMPAAPENSTNSTNVAPVEVGEKIDGEDVVMEAPIPTAPVPQAIPNVQLVPVDTAPVAETQTVNTANAVPTVPAQVPQVAGEDVIMGTGDASGATKVVELAAAALKKKGEFQLGRALLPLQPKVPASEEPRVKTDKERVVEMLGGEDAVDLLAKVIGSELNINDSAKGSPKRKTRKVGGLTVAKQTERKMAGRKSLGKDDAKEWQRKAREFFLNRFGKEHHVDFINYEAISSDTFIRQVEDGKVAWGGQLRLYFGPKWGTSVWNRSIATYLAKELLKKSEEDKCVLPKVSEEHLALEFLGQFETAYKNWSKAKPKLGESDAQAIQRGLERMKNETRAAKYRGRKMRKFERRVAVVNNVLAFPDREDRAAWEWLLKMLKFLDDDGMSSDSEGEIQIEKNRTTSAYFARIVPWRNPIIDGYMEIIDEDCEKPIFRLTKETEKLFRVVKGDAWVDDSRKIMAGNVVPGLPKALYNEEWLKAMGKTYVEEKVDISKEELNLLEFCKR